MSEVPTQQEALIGLAKSIAYKHAAYLEPNYFRNRGTSSIKRYSAWIVLNQELLLGSAMKLQARITRTDEVLKNALLGRRGLRFLQAGIDLSYSDNDQDYDQDSIVFGGGEISQLIEGSERSPIEPDTADWQQTASLLKRVADGLDAGPIVPDTPRQV